MQFTMNGSSKVPPGTTNPRWVESTPRVLGYSLLRLLARSKRSVLTLSLAPHCSLHSRAPLRSFVRSLDHSLTPELYGKVNDSMSHNALVLTHSASGN